jgi:hypothetical protein
MRCEVLTAVKMSFVFWIVTPSGLADVFLRNFHIYLQVHTALQPRTTTSQGEVVRAEVLGHKDVCKSR